VGLLGTLHRKRHQSGGNERLRLRCGEPLVAVRTVAAADVADKREADGVRVEVVGVVEDERLDRAEVALDPGLADAIERLLIVRRAGGGAWRRAWLRGVGVEGLAARQVKAGLRQALRERDRESGSGDQSPNYSEAG
jgi:hypothetical protein